MVHFVHMVVVVTWGRGSRGWCLRRGRSRTGRSSPGPGPRSSTLGRGGRGRGWVWGGRPAPPRSCRSCCCRWGWESWCSGSGLFPVQWENQSQVNYSDTKLHPFYHLELLRSLREERILFVVAFVSTSTVKMRLNFEYWTDSSLCTE